MADGKDPLIVVSKVKPILAAGNGVTSVSKEALQWVDDRTREQAELCAATGVRTPKGKLMAPSMLSGRVGGVMPDEDRKPPDRTYARAKEVLDAHGGDMPKHGYALVEVLGGVAHHTQTAGPCEVIILDRDNLKAALGVPECTTEINVLVDDLRAFAKAAKLLEYAELANEIEHKHAKLLKEFEATYKKGKKT